MEKYSEVLGRSVICIRTGKKIGVVKDIAFSPSTREVVALVLEHKGLDLAKKVIMLNSVLSFGNDVVIVNDESSIKALKKIENSGDFKGKDNIKGLKVYTKSGNDLGVVEDVLFDSDTGLVEGVEVSDGLLQDIAQGRNILPLFGKVEISDEFILVEKEAVEEIIPSGGGLKKFFNKERE